jgi:hypothetical protein
MLSALTRSLEKKSVPAKDKFAVKIIRAVSSTEFCQYKFDERDIRERLGAGYGHTFIILP